MDMTEVSIVHHIALVLLFLWALVAFGWAHPLAFFGSLLYLFAVNERYSYRLRKRVQFEERKYANQKRLLCDSETVRWLNHAVEKVWPICMEQIASQQFLLPIIPWFLDKYKPWTAKKAVVQHLYLGRNPPMFTEIRVLRESTDDDHLVLELGMNFLSADDMSAILAVQLRKRLGFGLWANMHVTGMHVEGKVLVGVKFLRGWPFLGRVRVCFMEPPYFQMTVKPIFSHGVDVTELPGIAGWLDKILAIAFEQTLVEPNMLVVDVEKFVSAPTGEPWFTVDEKPPIAYAKVEIVEAADMKPSDLNGLADPYVKGHLGPYRFRTKTQKKTLVPKWREEFKIPITSWDSPNVLVIEVRDKDHIFDDMLGDCVVNISELRGGQRHDKWLPLRNIKMGRLHLAITVLEDEDDKGKEQNSGEDELSKATELVTPRSSSSAPNRETDDVAIEEGRSMADEFEPIDIEGQEKTGIWVHRPGNDVSQTWEPRKGRARHPETQLYQDVECSNSPRSDASSSQSSDTTENKGGNKARRLKKIKQGLKKIGSMFHKGSEDDSPRREEEVLPTPLPNIREVGEKLTSVRVIFDDSGDASNGDQKLEKESCISEKGGVGSPGKGSVRGIAKGVIKQAGKSAQSLKSVLSRKGSAKLEDDEACMSDKREDYDESNDSLRGYPLAVGSASIDADNERKESVVQFSPKPKIDERDPPTDDGNFKVDAAVS